MSLPKGVIGVIGDSGSGASGILRTAEHAIVYEYTLDTADALEVSRAELEIERLRRAGCTVMLASHNPELLRRLVDEVWWVDNGNVKLQGHPLEVLPEYARHIAQALRDANPSTGVEISPSLRRGDGRAQIQSLSTMDASGTSTAVWTSGESVAIQAVVRFSAPVERPVIGIMIRTRIGFEVYGTNTELEGVEVGPCASEDVRTVKFAFRCELCPQIYTITAASHDPDGVWHDWMEDALSVTVVDTRYTAGVANLRAVVTCSPG